MIGRLLAKSTALLKNINKERTRLFASTLMEHTKLSTVEQTEAWLTQNQLPFKTLKHDPVATIDDMVAKVQKSQAAMFTKNLFLRNKKSGEYFLLLCLHDTAVDLKGFAKHLKVKADLIRGADLDTLKTMLNCEKGAVNVLSLVNDPENKVAVYVDDRIATLGEEALLCAHPMQNSATVEISKLTFFKVIELSGHTHKVLDFAQIKTAAVAPAPPKEEVKKIEADAGKQEDAHELSIQYKKAGNLAKWYQQVIKKADMIEYYDISGCYILRPWSYAIWERIQAHFDAAIKTDDVENVYFPMFVSKDALCKEESHIKGFAPEVAWVTKSGQSELTKPIAIRPTSETIMYPAYAKWIRSWRDLPLKLNQWTNIVRWEFKHPTPFIRTREFLWQEGHTAHATREEAVAQAARILDFYADTYYEMLAIPVIKGCKSENEKFAGADFTMTVEAYVSANGRSIQAATSHMLGQNFSKMFDITYEDKANQNVNVWQTSWGLSTRSIGTLVLIHGDNKGLVLPPRAAKIQAIIVPILYKGTDNEGVLAKAHQLKQALKAGGVRAEVDDDDTHNPGFKYNKWELKGVPLRLELGKNDMAAEEVKMVVRFNGKKSQAKWEGLLATVKETLDQVHGEMYESAKKRMFEHVKVAYDWNGFMSELNKRNLVLTPWSNTIESEEAVKEKSSAESKAFIETIDEEAEGGQKKSVEVLTGAAKTLCIPLDVNQFGVSNEDLKDKKCFHIPEQEAKVWALWGRSY